MVDGISKERGRQIERHDDFLMPEKLLEITGPYTPKYIIGIDDYDENCLNYCLAKIRDDNTMEILLQKTVRDERSFKEEVKNLARYFDAEIKQWR